MARDLIADVASPGGGSAKVPLPPIRPEAGVGFQPGDTPALASAATEILEDRLGFSREQINALGQKGAFGPAE